MILYAPFAARSPSLGGKPSPKDYPYARELAQLIEEKEELVQLGGSGDEQVCKDFRPNLSFDELGKLIDASRTGICVDSYLQHCYWYFDRRAIVLLGISDPLIFSHDIHLNLLRDRKYLRPKQFDLYYLNEYNHDAFVKPPDVLRALSAFP